MLEFVALRVSAEIVVIVQHQDPGAAADVLDEVIRRGETAHAGADDDQIVGLVGVRGGCQIDAPAIAERMRYFERPFVIAAHSGERGRIVAGRLLRREVLSSLHRVCPARQEQRAGGRDADPVDEVASGDLPIHAERAVVL